MGSPFHSLSTAIEKYRNDRIYTRTFSTGIFSLILFFCSLMMNSSLVLAEPSSIQVTESTLTVPYNGNIPKGPLKFPLYKGEGFQYFSAGVGLEERQVTYPPYPLKLILVQGGRAFLSNVAFTIRQLDGSLSFQIPAAHVEGPWVFLNIPTGTYLITAENSQHQKIEKQVSIAGDRTKTIHLRWVD